MNDYSNISDSPSYTGIIAPSVPVQGNQEEQTGVDSGVSSIEKSKSVLNALTPLANAPTLIPPNPSIDGQDAFVNLTVTASKGEGVDLFLMSQSLKYNEITNDMVSSWLNNIREIQEQVHQLLKSPEYQQLLLIQIHGDPASGVVSGIQSPLEANAAAKNPSGLSQQFLLNNFIQGLEAFERVPSAANVPESATAQDATKMLIPMAATLLAGGALTLGVLEMTTNAAGIASNAMNGVVELISHLQPVLPQLAMNVLPSINLLVMPLIYYTSWDSAIGNLRNKDKSNLLATAHEFARGVMKVAGNSQFVMDNIINKMPNTSQMSQEQKSQLAAIYALVLGGVALSLLYSVEVGKAMGGQFFGMEPQEFQGLLTGKVRIGTGNKDQLSPHDLLKSDLIDLIKIQLNILPPEERAKIIESLFEYLSGSRKVEHLLDPKKVFEEVFSNNITNPQPIGAA